MVKKRERSTPTEAQIEAFAGNVDKPKDVKEKAPKETQELARTTISLPASMLEKLEDLARANKRAKAPNRTVSAIIRDALEKSMK